MMQWRFRGGGPLFLDQNESRRAGKKIGGGGGGERPPTPRPPDLKVWIRHCDVLFNCLKWSAKLDRMLILAISMVGYDYRSAELQLRQKNMNVNNIPLLLRHTFLLFSSMQTLAHFTCPVIFSLYYMFGKKLIIKNIKNCWNPCRWHVLSTFKLTADIRNIWPLRLRTRSGFRKSSIWCYLFRPLRCCRTRKFALPQCSVSATNIVCVKTRVRFVSSQVRDKSG